MQNLWSRAAQLTSTCRCPSCVTSSKQGLSRQTTTDATQLTRFRYGNRFAFYSSSILATAAFADSFNKDKKRVELSRQIAEAKNELKVRQAEQDRRLDALGTTSHDLENERLTTGDSAEEAWFDGHGEPVHNDEHPKVTYRDRAIHDCGMQWKRWKRFKRFKRYEQAKKRASASIFDFYDLERQHNLSFPTNEKDFAQDFILSTGPLKWSPSPELDRRVNSLRSTYTCSSSSSSERPDLGMQKQKVEQDLGDPVYDLRILKMWDDIRINDQAEYDKLCWYEHRVQFDLYLQALQEPLDRNNPCQSDEPRDWTRLFEWAGSQQKSREILGFGNVPGISLQELQAFTPTQLVEITENGFIADMMRGIPYKQASKIIPQVEPLSRKKKTAMAMAMHKLVLSVLDLFGERENARRRQWRLSPLPLKGRESQIDFWSYYTRALNETHMFEDVSTFPIPPLPIYHAPFDHYFAKQNNQLSDLSLILHSCRYPHGQKMILVCIALMRSTVPLDVHSFNQILKYLCKRSDYDLAALFVQYLEESHLRPNEITVTWTLQYYRLSGRRLGFQWQTARMHAREGHLAVRDPRLMIPLLARSNFTMEKSLRSLPDNGQASRSVELQDEPYRPFPTDQKPFPRIYEKARFNNEVYSQLIQGALTFGYLDDAFGYFMEMVRHGWECSRDAYTSLLRHFTNTRDWVAGFGIWAHKGVLVSAPDANMYIQALKLCIVCGKWTEYQDVLADGMRSKVLDQEAPWPLSTLCNDGVVSVRLSWVMGLEAELRVVTEALAMEIESIKCCIDNANGDTVMKPVDVQSQLSCSDYRTSLEAPSETVRPEAVRNGIDMGSTTESQREKTVQAASKTPFKTMSHDLQEAHREEAIVHTRESLTKSFNGFVNTPLLRFQEAEPDWSWDNADSGFDRMESLMESVGELETLMSWPAESGYPKSQPLEDQEYVVVPAMHHRKQLLGPDSTRARSSVGNSYEIHLNNFVPEFRSVKLDVAESESSIVPQIVKPSAAPQINLKARTSTESKNVNVLRKNINGLKKTINDLRKTINDLRKKAQDDEEKASPQRREQAVELILVSSEPRSSPADLMTRNRKGCTSTGSAKLKIPGPGGLVGKWAGKPHGGGLTLSAHAIEHCSSQKPEGKNLPEPSSKVVNPTSRLEKHNSPSSENRKTEPPSWFTFRKTSVLNIRHLRYPLLGYGNKGAGVANPMFRSRKLNSPSSKNRKRKLASGSVIRKFMVWDRPVYTTGYINERAGVANPTSRLEKHNSPSSEKRKKKLASGPLIRKFRVWDARRVISEDGNEGAGVANPTSRLEELNSSSSENRKTKLARGPATRKVRLRSICRATTGCGKKGAVVA